MSKKPPVKNPLWESLTVGMDNKWSKRLLMIMAPVFIGLLIARPFIDDRVEKRMKLKNQIDEEEHLKRKEERLRKLKESDPMLAATIDNIEERKRASDQLLSKPKST